MNLSLKKILKQLDVLFISEVDSSYKKIENILRLFFKEVLNTNSLINANKIYEKSFPSILIIDINLKESSGLSFVKNLRKKNKSMPIIIITENKETDILIEAIKLNLIDYLLKPVDINKLIHALNLSAKNILNSGEIKTIITNDIIYNYVDKSITILDKKQSLTKNESRLLELFLINKNKFVKNEDIIKQIWSDKEVSSSAFKSLINRLSNKIGKDTISNSFGIGYGIISDKCEL
ncbi:signal transduction response regulator [Arcobacter acticola]|uniref:Signal transduction response regulator n=1 Tax=Arcobacter acticola TaxID=1849015 RepID=A0A6M8EM96_9BACT|nr:response regulator [Arcobacter acticola]QKE29668.1 signal transduction response regulator [Arcobacter acticola]